MIFLKTKKAKIILPTALILLAVVFFGLCWPHPALALTTVSELFGKAIGWLLYGILTLLTRLLVAVIQMLVAVATYNDFTTATAVVKGWVIARDVCNMFFIAVLLMMAFGTILKWETYRYNRLLGRLILMAFLINFSKFICGFFIDFFQVIMLTFVNAFSGVAAGTFANAFGIKGMLQISLAGDKDYDFSDIIGSLLLAMLLVIVALIVILAITLMLLMRIIWLWVLIVLSPVAFLLRTWPGGGEKFSSRWWGDFGKNLTTGPMLAFFLWLALTIMTTRGPDENLAQKELSVDKEAMSIEQSAVIEEGSAPPGSPLAQKFYTSISSISSSDQLLSYIISISLLIGALMMGQQMGGAGGQFLSWAQGKTGGLLRRAATLGAAGVTGGLVGAGLVAGWKKTIKPLGKSVGKWGLESFGAATGIETRVSKWKEAWAYKNERHQSEREAKMRSKAQQRFARGNIIGAAFGSPAYAANEFWRPGTVPKLGTLLSPKTMKRTEEEADKAREEHSELGKSLGMVHDEKTGQWVDPEQEELNEVIKEKTEAREKEIAADIEKERVKEENNLNEEILEVRGVTPEEAKKMRESSQYFKRMVKRPDPTQEGKMVDTPIYFDEEWQVAESGLRNQGKSETEIAEAKKKFTEEWDRIIAGEQMTEKRDREIIESNLRKEYTTPEKKEALRNGYITRQEKELDKLNTDKSNIQSGRLTTQQDKSRKDELAKLEKILEKIDKDIVEKQKKGLDTSADARYKTDTQEQIRILRDTNRLTEKEKAQQKDLLPTLESQIKKTQFKINYAKMSEGDKQGLLDELEAKKDKWVTAQKKYDEIRPAVDYEMRKAQRLAINKEKSEITTDSWQELASFIEDAKKKGDLNKVAAGYLKAAEYANANEIQNWFGYDSDAKGLKQYILGELVGTRGGLKKENAEQLGLSWEDYYDSHGIKREGFKHKKGMGMSFDQATAVGNDVSYTGEGVNHWGIARAVGVKNGRQVWQKEEDRLLEVMAEVRKVDFETAMRRFNRLALGNEYVKDQYDFRATGRRNFEMNDFALAFVKENFSKFATLMGRGRFGVNLAINLTKPINIQMMQEMAQEMPFHQRQAFQVMMESMKQYGTGGLGEFADLLGIQNMRSSGRFAA